MLGTNVELAIVGNKCDLERNRTVPLAEAEAYAASVNAKHYGTSAKLNKGIDELFLDLSKRMLAAKTATAGSAPPAPTNTIQRTLSDPPARFLISQKNLTIVLCKLVGTSNQRSYNTTGSGGGSGLKFTSSAPEPKPSTGCCG